jgi:cyclin A
LDPTTVEELVYISDNTYDRNQLIAFESELLDILQFELAAVTEKNFLRRYLMAAAAEIQCEVTLERTVHLSHYLIERTMQDFRFVRYKPSIIACSAICVALHTFGKISWTSTLQNYTKVSVCDESFRSCTCDLLRLFQYARSPQGQRQLQAVNEKYKSLFLETNISPPQHYPYFLAQ